MLGDFIGSSIAKATAKATAKSDPCAKGLAAMGEGAGNNKIAKADAETVHFTNGNWTFGKGCWHTDQHCPALKLATTGITAGTLADAKARGLQHCGRCPVRTPERTVQETLSLSNDSDCSNDHVDCENYMFSVTAPTDVHTAILSSCDTAQESGLFRGLELAFQTETAKLDGHLNETGYFFTVCELPELKHLLKTGKYTGESAIFGNWCLWTDALSATNHWLMRYRFGTEDWQARKDTEKHFLVGLKLDCTRLCNDLLCKELGVFNKQALLEPLLDWQE
jgi:hypothetical protein